MKVSRIILFTWVLLFIPIMVYGSDSCDIEMVNSWQNQRDESLVTLLRLWLNKATRDQMNGPMLSFVENEIFLSHCSPPLDPDELYISHLKNVKAETLPIALLKLYLKRCGFELHAANFFRGKSFRLLKK